MAVLELLHSPKLISRNFWMTEKSWNFHTVHLHIVTLISEFTWFTFLLKVFVYEYNENGRRWVRVESLVAINDCVHDIAFAPNIGRSYQLLAIATNKDLRIISMKKSTNELTNRPSADQASKYEVRIRQNIIFHSWWTIAWTWITLDRDETSFSVFSNTKYYF